MRSHACHRAHAAAAAACRTAAPPATDDNCSGQEPGQKGKMRPGRLCPGGAAGTWLAPHQHCMHTVDALPLLHLCWWRRRRRCRCCCSQGTAWYCMQAYVEERQLVERHGYSGATRRCALSAPALGKCIRACASSSNGRRALCEGVRSLRMPMPMPCGGQQGRCVLQLCPPPPAAPVPCSVLDALANGSADYRTSGSLAWPPGGSMGNGGVMRIAPVGLAYRQAVATWQAGAGQASSLLLSCWGLPRRRLGQSGRSPRCSTCAAVPCLLPQERSPGGTVSSSARCPDVHPHPPGWGGRRLYPGCRSGHPLHGG